MADGESRRFRTLYGPLYVFQVILEVLIPLTGVVFLVDLPLYLGGISLFNQQYLGFFLGLVMALLFLLVPGSPRAGSNRVPWYDVVFAGLSLVSGLYVAIFYPHLIYTIGLVTLPNMVLGLITVFLVLEGTRRLTGWPLVVIAALFILYARFGYLLPGALTAQQVSWGRLINQLYLGAEAIFGIALRTAGTVVFAYVFLSHVLFGTGGAEFLFKLAESLMGRFRGGPAKVAILASSFFGTISGSAVANVVSTGTVTIPLMKKIGYRAEFAGAVEAVASTGGTITPPVMGAAAFVMAEFLGIPYAQVALAAIVPAIMYYLGLFMQVDLRAARRGLVGLPGDQLPRLGRTLLQGWIIFLPLLLLIYTLFGLDLRPEVGAMYTLVAVVLLALLRPDLRVRLRNWLGMLQSTSRGLLEVVVICAAAGLVIGVVSYTSLGLSLSRVLTEFAGGNLLLLAVVTAAVSIILGMGIPVTASYLLLAVLAAPAFVKLDVPPLVAHLFVFYFGSFSFITPPVCLAAYAAASIANGDLMRTASQAIKLAIAGYIVPFIFIFNPALIFMGTALQVAEAIGAAVLAVVAVAVALEAFLFNRPVSLPMRLLFLLAGLVLFLPVPTVYNIAAALALAVLLALQRWGSGKRQHAPVKG